MKKVKLNLFTLILLILTINCSLPVAIAKPPVHSDYVSVSFQFFYDDLASYGKWVSYPGYGYVWIPGVSGFRPYLTNGHWTYTDVGWMWVSEYDWGWAPFHYGTWQFDQAYGWMWVPGYDWAPAWVVWGSYNGYYGWAPVAPGFSVSLSYRPSINYWCFAQPQYMVSTDLNKHYYGPRGSTINIGGAIINNERNIHIVNNVNNYNSRSYNAGPPRQEVEKTAKTSIKTVEVSEKNRPGRAETKNGAIAVYRPEIKKEDKSSAKPAKVVPLENLKSKNDARGKGLVERHQNESLQPIAIPQQKKLHPQELQEGKEMKQSPATTSPDKPDRQIKTPPEPSPMHEHRQPINPEKGAPMMNSKKRIERSLPEPNPGMPQQDKQPAPVPHNKPEQPPHRDKGAPVIDTRKHIERSLPERNPETPQPEKQTMPPPVKQEQPPEVKPKPANQLPPRMVKPGSKPKPPKEHTPEMGEKKY